MRFGALKRKTITVIRNPKAILFKLLYTLSPLFSDKMYLRLLFPLSTGYRLNLNSPETFNEKLQWLKLNYRKPVMTKMVDKYEAKIYVKDIIGDEYIIETYGVWDRFEDIDFDTLPDQFVLKTTHDQGGVVICTDKTTFDKEKVRNKLNKHLQFKHYYLGREWPYKDVQPRIIAEKLLVDPQKKDLWDYKFYCFHGVPKLMYISMKSKDRTMTLDFYDMEFNHLDIERPNIGQSDQSIAIPEKFDLMKRLASKISTGFPHLRVDFYCINQKVYVGELTFFQGGGMMPFLPEKWDYILGSWIDLEKVVKT